MNPDSNLKPESNLLKQFGKSNYVSEKEALAELEQIPIPEEKNDSGVVILPQDVKSIDGIVERIFEGGNLLANLELIDVNTWQTSQEVYRDWQNGVKVEGVNTANMVVHRIVDGEAVFDLLGRESNLFVDDKFRKEVYDGILKNEFFIPRGEMKDFVLSAIKSGQSVSVKYSGLNIKTDNCDSNYCYIELSKKNTVEEKKLFSAVYGTENPGDGKKIYLLRKNIVEEQLKNRNEDFVARACYFDNLQYFDADDRYIGNCLSAVRGVRRSKDVAEGDAKNNSGVK